MKEYPEYGTYTEQIEWLKNNLELCQEMKVNEITTIMYEGRHDSAAVFCSHGRIYVYRGGFELNKKSIMDNYPKS